MLSLPNTKMKRFMIMGLNRALWKLFYFVKPVYHKVFSRQLGIDTLDSNQILNSVSDAFAINPRHTYFILHASYADKWCILSFLVKHFEFYANTRIIAAHQDRSIVELFAGATLCAQRFLFVDKASVDKLSSCFRAVSKESSQVIDFTSGLAVTPYLLKNGMPPGKIRHLHIVYYPYFNELLHLHAVSYGTLLKTLLYLPAVTRPAPPCHYSENDIDHAKKIATVLQYGTQDSGPSLPVILFNVVNFSHASLSLQQTSMVVALLEARDYGVLLNVSQANNLSDYKHLVSNRPNTALVEIPPNLLALVCDQCFAVIGVLGGAMNIAVQFSNTQVLSLQTISLFSGCSEDDLLGSFAKEKVWEWVDQDWPCLHPGRVVVNTFIGDPSTLTNESLTLALQSFLQQLPASAPRQLNVL